MNCATIQDRAMRNPPHPLRARMTRVLRHRMQRTVRRALGSEHPLARLRPAWRATHRRLVRLPVDRSSALCAATDCRYHLAEFVLESKYEHVRTHTLQVACALIAADEGGLTQDEIAGILGVYPQNVQHVEQRAYTKRSLRALASLLGRSHKRTITLADRVRNALNDGEEWSMPELAKRCGADKRDVLAALEAMSDEVTMTKSPIRNVGRRWRLAA